MEIELTPEPEADVAEAVAEAIERALSGNFEPEPDPGPWWRAGIRENVDPDLPYPG